MSAAGYRAHLVAAALIACACMPAAAAERRHVTLSNAEDLALVDGGRWVIASSMFGGTQASGAIVSIGISDGAVRRLYPGSASARSGGQWNCPGEVAADVFAPHGIALQPGEGGKAVLYVVNHGGRESIEMFELEPSQPGLRWLGCAVLPPGAWGNSVAVAADGTLFVTNMGQPIDGSKAISEMGGDVLSWSPTGGWKALPNSAVVAPNGLLLSADGRRLYVASWAGSEIVELTLKGAAVSRRVLALPFLPDNLRWRHDGTLLAAGQKSSVEAVTACYLSKTACTDPIPSSVAEIDAAAFALRCASAVPFDMATVALDVADEIWIGTARGRSLLRLPRSVLSSGCR